MLHSISGTMTHNAYNRNHEKERTSTVSVDSEYALGVDPSSGVFFTSDFRRHEDLREMLDSNKDNLKLEAMRRIIGMIAKGRDASMLFPAVVKNVVSKNIELKKLVYSYLERYAEEKEDLALLSISTFQRALKEPNQLIRAGALRVLSGIRVSMISPIVMIAIRDASADMSPYVRKTAAHAIPKLYRLDPETKTELVVIINKLLADRTVLVLGSAVMAFTKVCPERVDLIHLVYRKLCALLADIDEWGQVVIIQVLTRYARTQFTNPSLHEKEEAEKSFYESTESEGEEAKKPEFLMDPDHRLLLKSARPLLQSRNAAVVMSAAQMYHHIGTKAETMPAVKALIRLLRSSPEVQELVLKSIVTMTITRKGAFDMYLKSFFVRTTDSTRIKLLKLTVLTNIASENNISIILRELETYISSYDDDFVAATIQAIGRCACFISTVTDTCLTGLVTLLSNKNEIVVAESVVVIKRLLQTQATNPTEIIRQMIRLLDNIEVAQARASIMWLLGEHCRDIPIASNVLKKAAKSFTSEEDTVKLQVLNLAVKLFIHNRKDYELICQYIFNLAKYDQSYDIRDRARLLRFFIDNPDNKLASSAASIFLASKPAPTYRNIEEIEQFQLGSMSHAIGSKAVGYEDLPEWPEVAPPGDVRNSNEFVVKRGVVMICEEKGVEEKRETTSAQNYDSWSSDEGSSSSSYTEEQRKDGNQASTTSESTSSETESSDEDEEEEVEEEEDDDEEDEQTSDEDEDTDSAPVSVQKPSDNPKIKNQTKEESEGEKAKSNLELLLDLESNGQAFGPILTPLLGGFITPNEGDKVPAITGIRVVQPVQQSSKTREVLNRIHGRGLTIQYRYTRNPHLFSAKMVNINLVFTNTLNEEITDIHLGQKNLASGMNVHEFACISTLSPECSLPGTLGIDFNDSMHAANLEIISSLGTNSITINPEVGELMRPVTMPEEMFLKEQSKLKGMNEHTATVSAPEKCDVQKVICEVANVGVCSTVDSNTYRFSGQTLASSSLVLIQAIKGDEQLSLVVNCEKMVIGSMLLNELKCMLQ